MQELKKQLQEVKPKEQHAQEHKKPEHQVAAVKSQAQQKSELAFVPGVILKFDSHTSNLTKKEIRVSHASFTIMRSS